MKNKKARGARRLTALLLVLIACNLAALGYFSVRAVMRWREERPALVTAESIPQFSGDIFLQETVNAGSNVDQKGQLGEHILADAARISLNTGPTFLGGEGDVRIEVAEECQYAYTFQYVDITSGETLASTGLIYPGEYLLTKKLEEPPEPGSYPVVITMTAYDLKTQEYLGQSAVNGTIHVQ